MQKTSPGAAADATGIGRWQTPALIAGVIGALLSAVGALIDRRGFFRAYLPSYIFWFDIAAGALTLQMLQYITGGEWGIMIRRPLGAAGRTLPLLALLFIPIVLGMNDIYAWTDSALVQHDIVLQRKKRWLNPTWFTIRTVIFFGIMIAFALVLRHLGNRFAETRSPYVNERRNRVSAAGVLIMVLTLTFVSIDWIMSLEPKWYSTIFGVSFVIGAGLSAFAFVTFFLSRLADTPAMSEILRPSHLRDLGNLTLAFVMLWAYTAFSEFMLIWYANLKEEIPYFLKREQGGWGVLAAALIIFHFFLPFFLLLMRPIKDRASTIGIVAVLILVMRYLDVYWLTAPAWYPEGFHYSWMDLATLVGIGGIWMWFFIGQLKGQSIIPIHETWVEEALREGAVRHHA